MTKQEFLNGRIVLHNTDCLDFMANMQEKVDLILTDPPYGILDHKIETNINIELFLNNCNLILNNNKFLIYFGQQPTITNWNYLANKIFNYKNEVIWYKRKVSCIFTEMMRVFENIMIYTNGKANYNDIKIPYSDVLKSMADYVPEDSFFKNINLLENLCKENKIDELKDFLKNKPIKKLKSKSCGSVWKMKETTSSREISTYKKIRDGYKIQNLISFCEHNHFKNYNHPTIKPIKLLTYLINLCSQENELVFDGFSGSGSCAVACIKTNRRFIGCELDNQYFDLACKRIETELKQGDLF
jgi:site-specific DNA-methyltransferase (adenine-specific)